MQIIVEKDVLTDAQDHDDKAKESGFMIGIPGELYLLSVSQRSAVYIEKINGLWVAYRATYLNGKKKSAGEKTIATANTLPYVILQAKHYFDYLGRMRRN